MHIVICNERFLFRFGLDRALILLGKHLRAQGNKITVLANRYDKEVLSSFADQIVDIPTSDADYYNLNEFTADWLKKNWNNIFPKQLPDLVFIGGWPFFTAIKNFNELNIPTVFFDCGAVPMDKFEGGGLAIQQKVRKLRK